MNLKKIKIISIIGILILSFISHFMYDLFPNIIFSFIFPVNESIWEHMKILFTSILLYGFIDKYLLNKYNIKHNNFPFQLYFTAISSIPLYLTIYIPIYKLLGETNNITIIITNSIYNRSIYKLQPSKRKRIKSIKLTSSTNNSINIYILYLFNL